MTDSRKVKANTTCAACGEETDPMYLSIHTKRHIDIVECIKTLRYRLDALENPDGD